MSRMAELQARRRVLLARCELQRAELAERVSHLHNDPLRRAAAEVLGGSARRGVLPFGRPLMWVVALAGLVLLRRPRQVLSVLVWARTAVSVASRAAGVVRTLGQLRAARAPRTRGTAEP